MQVAWPAKRLSTVALVMLGWVVIGLALPLLVPLDTSDSSLGGASLSAAPRHSYVVAAPIELSDAPGFTLDRGTLYPVSASGKSLSGEASNAALASGSARIAVDGAAIRLGAMTHGAWPATWDDRRPNAPIIDAVARLGFETLVLRRSAVTLIMPDGRKETLTDVAGEVVNKRKAAGTIQIAGTGSLRGQQVRFDVTTSLGGDKKGALRATLPLKFTVKGRLIDIAFEGALVANPVLSLQGPVDIRITDLRQLGHLFHSGWSAGPGLRDVRLRGDLEWAGQGLVVSKAQLAMDGNEATGFLTLKLSGARPQVAGTLALKSLVLTPYAAATDDAGKVASSWRSWLTTGDMTEPLIKHFDADVRISADKLTLGSIDLGRSASSITVTDGRMVADVAEMEFNGGKGGGQITLDHSIARPRITLRGKLEGVDTARTGTALFGHSYLTGRSTIVADLATTGYSTQELAQAVSGKLAVSVREGGRLGLDLRSLLAAAQKKEIEGWGTAHRSQTAFDQLDARFSIRNGQFVTDQVEATIADVPVSAIGTISLPTSRIDFRVVMGAALSPNGKPDALIFSGAMALPLIRSEATSQAAQQPAPAMGPQRRS